MISGSLLCAGMTIECGDSSVKESMAQSLAGNFASLIPALRTFHRIPHQPRGGREARRTLAGETAGRGRRVASSPWAKRTESNWEGQPSSPDARDNARNPGHPGCDSIHEIDLGCSRTQGRPTSLVNPEGASPGRINKRARTSPFDKLRMRFSEDQAPQ